ncbi:MAG: sulfatase [Planctomycetaceae bacterium]|nr:sulfatase [Planctomycetaceae bacterium]|tara:strand:+ start:727 stop:2559 length:1833 start_codon:yes stop_codon:yes gene_type:complete
MHCRIIALLVGLFLTDLLTAADRPNIVWLLSEDNSIHYMQHYGSPHGATPAISQLAEEGITFNHAFSNSPVCSVARTTLMTGILGPRAGFHYHRKMVPANLPTGVNMVPVYLRQAGYYCTNNNKQDYNVVTEKVWDESSRMATWRKRPDKSQPFFHMQSFGMSHESSLHFKWGQINPDGLTTKPDAVKLPPYFPDTPLFRYTQAFYHDRMTVIDSQIGKIVEQLKADGVFDNTIIFYFGDHGGVLPRSKGYIYEGGLHVPLIVRFPGKYKHLFAAPQGSREDGFVSFIDFSPTVLRLAGLEVPGSMDGLPFAGKGVTAESLSRRDEAFGYADRFDERYEFARSFRKGKYKYIRAYEHFYPDSMQNNYRYRQLAFAQWRELHGKGELNEAQSHFFTSKPVELLFDVEADPHEVENLAERSEFQSILKDLRGRLQQKMKSIHDLSLYPENQMIDLALKDGIAFGEKHSREIEDLLDVVDLALLPWDQAGKQLSRALKSNNPRVRYWAVTASAAFGEKVKPLLPSLKGLLDDTDAQVRIRAAEVLGMLRAVKPQSTIYDVLATSDSNAVAAAAMNAIVFLQDHHGYEFRIDASMVKASDEPLVQRRLEYLNAE